jgi:hypothetical protein
VALTAPNVAGLAVAALAAATILPDHRVIILAFLVDAAVYAAARHSLAHAPMRVIPDRETLRQALTYGLPLMLNGVGLALISQADRMVVGRFFGMDILGVYALTLSLAVAPISPLMQTVGTLGFFFTSSQPRHSEALFGNLSLADLVLRVPRLRLCCVYRIDVRCSGTVRVRQSLCGGDRYGDPYFRHRVSANSARRRTDRVSLSVRRDD